MHLSVLFSICNIVAVQSFLTLCNTMDCSHSALLSMGFPRQEYWSGLPFLLPGDRPDPDIEPRSPALQADTTLNHQGSPAATAAKSLQSCPTLCNPIDGSPPGSTVPGILQARTLEWVAISSPMHESEK